MKFLVVTFFALLMAVPALTSMAEEKGVVATPVEAKQTASSVEQTSALPAPSPESPVPTATPAPTTAPSPQPEPVPATVVTEQAFPPGESVPEDANAGYYDADGVWVPLTGFVGGCH